MNEEVTLQTIENIRNFMFKDLAKTIGLVNSCDGAPNFMLAMILCCYTDFWGRLMIGPEKTTRACFETFFSELGTKYGELLKRKDIYDHVRCGLVHEYSIKSAEGDDSMIKIEDGDCGIMYDNEIKNYTFYVRKYLEDFKIAVDKYIEELKADSNKFNLAKQVLERKKIKLI